MTIKLDNFPNMQKNSPSSKDQQDLEQKYFGHYKGLIPPPKVFRTASLNYNLERFSAWYNGNLRWKFEKHYGHHVVEKNRKQFIKEFNALGSDHEPITEEQIQKNLKKIGINDPYLAQYIQKMRPKNDNNDSGQANTT